MLGNKNNAWTNVRYSMIRAIGSGRTFWHGLFFVGGRSILEYVFVVACIAIGIIFCLSGSGGAAAMLGLVVILCGLRYNVIGFIAGISFERALFWHKVLAVVTLAVSIAHALKLGYNTSGFFLLLCMGIASVAYALKPYFFEAFYYIHVVCNVGIIAFAMMHGASLLAFGGFIWCADLFVRYIFSLSRVEATLEVLPANVVRISFPKGTFKYCAGQYCFIMIPALGLFDFHPFTISSAPHETDVKFHIRALGDWTKRLHKLVEEKSTDLEGGIRGVKMTVHVEGPFGTPSVDFEHHESSKVILLVTGGIGVTPAQSIFNHLIHEYCEEGRELRKCIYIWTVKDRAMISSVDESRVSEKNIIRGSKKEVLPRSFQPNLLDFDGTESKVVPDEEKAPLVMEVGVSSNAVHPSITIKKSRSFSFKQETLASKDPFHVEFYLTSIRNKEEFAAANIDPEHQPYLKFGRPNLPEKWKSIAEMCVREGIPRVAVLVCGPEPMVVEVSKLCSTAYTVSTKNDLGTEVTGSVIFDLHKEEFDF